MVVQCGSPAWWYSVVVQRGGPAWWSNVVVQYNNCFDFVISISISELQPSIYISSFTVVTDVVVQLMSVVVVAVLSGGPAW